MNAWTTKTWTTKSGKKINISNLSNDHLLSIKNMLEKKGYVHSNIALSCLAYSGCAPDGAAMAAEAAFNDMKFNAVSDAIFDEYDKRNLK